MPRATETRVHRPGRLPRPEAFGAGDRFAYRGRELEAMARAENYHRWVLETFRPHLGTRLVEVGAGAGSFSALLWELRPDSLALVEPAPELCARLEEWAEQMQGVPRPTVYNAPFRDVADVLAAEQRPDSVLYVNVLEHVEDDEGELASVCQTLGAGGRLFVFGPAMPWLYGPFDEEVGHFRRYTKRELEGKCARAGFRVVLSRYFDLLGVVPWWLKYRLLRSRSLGLGAVAVYDRLGVPVTKALEKLFEPPVGKNVLLVAEKR